MNGIAYVNGRYRSLSEAAVSIEDRGFQFADSIYEVWAVRDGRLLDAAEHMARFTRSLAEIKIAAPMSETSLLAVIQETARRNNVRDGVVYVQVSRGATSRDHAFPPASLKPTIVITAKSLSRRVLDARADAGVAIISTPDTRWARCDIKSVNLLPNVLAKQAARGAGAFEAWFVDEDNYVTEGAATSAWIVDAEGQLRTRELSHRLLHGVTRAVLLRLARERQMPVLEQQFSVREAQGAREAFMSSASNPAVAIVSIDGVQIGEGRPGPVTKALRALYFGAQA